MDDESLVASLDELVRAGCRQKGITATAILVTGEADPKARPREWIEMSAVKAVAGRRYNFGGMIKGDELVRVGPSGIASAFNAQAIHALAYLDAAETATRPPR
jgi:hypothetical protein